VSEPFIKIENNNKQNNIKRERENIDILVICWFQPIRKIFILHLMKECIRLLTKVLISICQRSKVELYHGC